MSTPAVDVVIAVHSRTRPIARAVASVLNGSETPVHVIVVAHNIDASIIAANLGDLADDPAVTVVQLNDGIRSPAGPFNAGIAAGTAPYFAVLGSDDELAPGAIDSWMRRAAQTGADVVIGKIAIGDRVDPYPPVRIGRRDRLAPAADRLAYRSAPLGLISRVRFGGLRFTEGLASGEDLAFSAELWFTGANISYDLDGPAYVVHADATDRVTFAPRAVADDFAFIDAIAETAWFGGLHRRDRLALTIKIARVHLFDAILARLDSIVEHRSALLGVVERLNSIAPGTTGLLSIADRAVLDEVGSDSPSADRIRHLLDARWNYRTAQALLTRSPLRWAHQQAPFRTLYAGIRAQTSTTAHGRGS